MDEGRDPRQCNTVCYENDATNAVRPDRLEEAHEVMLYCSIVALPLTVGVLGTGNEIDVLCGTTACLPALEVV